MAELGTKAAQLLGLRLRRARLQRNWSQEGLCRGICAVSWLSKIEQGQAAASPEVLALLLDRLDLPHGGLTDGAPQLGEAVERQYELLFSGDEQALADAWPAFSALLPQLSYSLWCADALLLAAAHSRDVSAIDPSWAGLFDARQTALYLLLQGQARQASEWQPTDYFLLQAGIEAYEKGEYYAALPLLSQSYDRAARAGQAYLMLAAMSYTGNSYCNLLMPRQMEEAYTVARRLAVALGQTEMLETIEYNRASAQLEAGEYRQAHAYFSSLEQPGPMALHKLAVCCEKLGDRAGALRALDRAEQLTCDYPPPALAGAMLALVRFRLLHSDYLEQPAYGELLLGTFEELRRALPIGYATFHLPWVMEWYVARRQYKQAYQLACEFSGVNYLHTFPKN